MNTDLDKVIVFLHETEKLKSTIRKYPQSNGRPESTAEHTWRLSLMSFMIVEQLHLKIDIAKAMQIAIVHDLAEAYAGDFDGLKVYDGRIKKEVKEKAEKEAIIKLLKHLPKERGDKIYALWLEYEEEKTPEARYIKALDKMETTLQYIETDPKLREGLEHIASEYTDSKVKNFPELKPLLKSLKKDLKTEFQRTDVEWKKSYDVD
jgi:putative hydrolase of HD superfamily